MGLKSLLHQNFWGRYLISEYHVLMSFLMPRLVSDETAIRRYYRWKSGGRAVNLEHPVRFSEKLQWYKLHHRDPLMQRCADKYAARSYLQEIGYGHLLNDLYGVYGSVREIDFDALPRQFVLKAAHGSGFNIIVPDKAKLNRFQARRMLSSWLRQEIFWHGREWVYHGMPRRIIAERFLQDDTGELRDYKFFCFNGVPRFMQLEVGRFTDHNTRNFYDMDWKLCPFGKELPHNPNIQVAKPAQFEEMKQIAANLCKPFQYVRVDLYQVGGKVYFGELTFFPASGAPDFVPDEYDTIVGNLWKLEE